MDKRELLLSIGFSEAYVNYLDKLDEPDDTFIREEVSEEYRFKPKDVSNVIVEEPRTSFITRVIVQPKNF